MHACVCVCVIVCVDACVLHMSSHCGRCFASRRVFVPMEVLEEFAFEVNDIIISINAFAST